MSARRIPALSARARLWLLFLGLALATLGVLAGGAWLGARAALPAPLPWLLAALLLLACQALVWLLLERGWVRPGAALARELQLLLHANPEHELALPQRHGLGELVPAVQALAERWRTSQAGHEAALAQVMARASDQQRRLEAVLRDLSDGLIACAADRRILLFNEAALQTFGGSPDLGLDRPLDRLLAREPVVHAFEQLRKRHAAAPAEFLCGTADGGRQLRCRMALILAADGAPCGFVLDFVDATARLAADQAAARLQGLIEAQRAPLAVLRAAAEVLALPESPAADQRAAFIGIVAAESAALSARLETLSRVAEELAGGETAGTDLYSADLARWSGRHLADSGAPVTLTAVGAGHWLHGDGRQLSLLIAVLAAAIGRLTGVAELDLEVAARGRRVDLDLVWPGAPLALGTLEAWLDQPLAGPGEGLLRDVVRRHRSELWSQPHTRPGHALLRLPLPGPCAPQLGAAPPAPQRLPPRPEFYDFDLLTRAAQPASLLERALGDLGYVVFDTETTGLDPAGGDRIVQIAAVRIVNRRLLTGEVFDALVDPGRPIPKASIRFHGITDEMVRGRPPLEVVLPQFHAFAEGAVLVAHNAAFDMAFLRREEARLGLSFDQPVLDTLLLSAVLHDHTAAHGLDAIAARFGITLVGRHQALGDATGTGQLFLRMLELLEARGVRTLGEALALAGRAGALRRRQVEQFAPRRGRAVRVTGQG
jgi:DNA polymerase III subunit epsilon